jgi:hypothetical protein
MDRPWSGRFCNVAAELGVSVAMLILDVLEGRRLAFGVNGATGQLEPVPWRYFTYNLRRKDSHLPEAIEPPNCLDLDADVIYTGGQPQWKNIQVAWIVQLEENQDQRFDVDWLRDLRLRENLPHEVQGLDIEIPPAASSTEPRYFLPNREPTSFFSLDDQEVASTPRSFAPREFVQEDPPAVSSIQLPPIEPEDKPKNAEAPAVPVERDKPQRTEFRMSGSLGDLSRIPKGSPAGSPEVKTTKPEDKPTTASPKIDGGAPKKKISDETYETYQRDHKRDNRRWPGTENEEEWGFGEGYSIDSIRDARKTFMGKLTVAELAEFSKRGRPKKSPSK